MFSYIFDQVPLHQRNEGHSKVFVGHSYKDEGRADLRSVVRRAFEPDLTPYYADAELGTEHLLIKIARRIAVSRLVLFDISQPNPNVMVEIGLALGINKQIILCCHENANIDEFIQGINIIKYSDYTQLGEILERQKYQPNTIITSPQLEFCQLCQQRCVGREKLAIINEKHGLIVDDAPLAGHQEDFELSITNVLKSINIKAITLDVALRSERRILCALVHAVQMSRLTIFRFVDGMSLLVPFLFGLSFGMRVPSIMLVERSETVIPSDLGGYDYYKYQSFSQVQEVLSQELPVFIRQIDASFTSSYWNPDFHWKAIEALGNIESILAQPEMKFEDKLQAALILGLYAVRSRAGSLMLFSSHDTLRIVALVAPNVAMDAVGEWREFNISEGICGYVARTKKPYLTGDVHNDKYYVKRTFDKYLMSLAAAPIIYTEEVLGVFNADSKEVDFFDQTDIKIIEAVAERLVPLIVQEKLSSSNKISDSDDDSTYVQTQLSRGPVCLKCNQPSVVLHFRRIEDEEGLRYRMISTCKACGNNEDIRTYMLS